MGGGEVPYTSYIPVLIDPKVKHGTLTSTDVPVPVSTDRLWSGRQSSWLQTQRSRVRFPALPDSLSGSRCGMRFTQPEVLLETVCGSGVEQQEQEPHCVTSQKTPFFICARTRTRTDVPFTICRTAKNTL
jgi:hypothetical protein